MLIMQKYCHTDFDVRVYVVWWSFANFKAAVLSFDYYLGINTYCFGFILLSKINHL
jgi:hypothetical protein